MSDEQAVQTLPAYGSEKVIKRMTVGSIGEHEQDVRLRFEDFSNSQLAEKTCIGCGYDRSRGLWTGIAGRMIGGNPIAFTIQRCPACNIEEVIMPRRSQSCCGL